MALGMSRQFNAWRELLRKYIDFSIAHGPLTHDRFGAPEVVAHFTSRELTALKDAAAVLRDPDYRVTLSRPFEYNVMALRDVLIEIDAISYDAAPAELERARNAFRRVAKKLLEDLKCSEVMGRELGR